jgi:predicted O-linked N-acetylglucosamine transferase (SPINDLY family)
MKGSLSAIVLSCAVFSGLTLPLAAFGSKVIQVEFQKEHIFAGRLRDVAVPYLAASGLISLGVGAVSLSVAGWRASSRRSSKTEDQLSQLQQELLEKQSRIEELQLSDSYLRATGLKMFMGESIVNESVEQSFAAHAQHLVAAEESLVNMPTSITSLYVPPSQLYAASSQVQSVDVVAAKSVEQQSSPALSSAGEAKTTASRGEFTSNLISVEHSAVVAQFTELQSQLQSMATQMERLQAALAEPAQSVVAEAEVVRLEPAKPELVRADVVRHEPARLGVPKVVSPAAPAAPADASVIEHLHRRLQQLESSWVSQQVAS